MASPPAKTQDKAIDPRLLVKLGTLRQLEIFLKVAEVGGIAAAAEQLYVAQPSVSMQMKKLSTAVGLPLYEVIGRRLKLTEAGHQVAVAAREVLGTLDRLHSSLNDLKGLQAGTLRIAVDSSAKYFLPRLLGPFCQRYPGIEVEFKEGDRRYLLDRLSNNLDDFYIFNHVPADLDIVHYHFLSNPLVVVATRQHPLAQRRTIDWQELAGERFIIREKGSGSRVAVDEFLQAQQWSLGKVMALGSSEAIKQSVMSAMGVGILSAYALVHAEAEGLVQLPVTGFPIMAHWHVVHLRQKKHSLVAASFLKFMREEGEQHLPMDAINERIERASPTP